MLIYLQTRTAGGGWRTDGYWRTERTAYAHLASVAENSAGGTYRLATWEGGGSPWDGVSNPTRVLAVRLGSAKEA
jgi:hypothetical protein